MKSLAAVLTLVATALFACSRSSPSPEPVIASEKAPAFKIPKTKAECAKARGTWTWLGAPYPYEPNDDQGICVVALPTAGKTCKSSSTCGGGYCLAAHNTDSTGLGRCADTNFNAGCKSIVTNGKASPTLCVD